VKPSFDIVIIGLSITSSWGNGHATTYRSLVGALAVRGRRVLFLEHDVPWYAENRDMPQPFGAVTELYFSFDDLVARFESAVSAAPLVIVGSFVKEGARVGQWVTSVAQGRTAFYDIDTPVTLAQLEAGERQFITPELIPRYNAYFSFTGGPVLDRLQSHYGSPMARALYCSVDPSRYFPDPHAISWDLGYLGTYSEDRQPSVDALLLEPARRWRAGRFAVVGAMYPTDIEWPANVETEVHLSPDRHRAFYNSQRFTLNITRVDMKRAGFSPSVRLFEAGACGTPIISDYWSGLDEFFRPGEEILIAHNPEDTMRHLRDIPDEHRAAIGLAARKRVLAEHTAAHRARQLETYLAEMNDYVPADSARADSHNGHLNHRLAAGASPRRDWSAPGPGAGRAVGGGADSSHLYQPSRARDRDGRANSEAPPTEVSVSD